jgi:hypothetical protein
MSQKKPNLHMSFPSDKSDILPPLQKLLVLFLAKNDPQTVNEVVKSLKGSYKSYWTAFNSLKEKQLIQIVSTKSYRGREYPRFWVSPTGVLLALFEGVSSTILLEKSLVIYPKDTSLQAILEVSPILGTEAFKLAFQIILSKGKLEQSDLTIIIFTEMQKDLDISKLEPLLAILKKHPEQFEITKAYAENISKKMSKLESLFK